MSAGTFVKPSLPGSAITFVGRPIQRVAPSFADIVALPVTHTWGPEGPTLLQSFADWEDQFGTDDSEGRQAVLQTFAGSNLPGQGGAGAVLVSRLVSASGVASHATINNTAPAAAITLTAKYKGSGGDHITFSVAVDPNVSGNDLLSVLYKGVLKETYSYPATDITNLAAQINSVSKWVVASGVTSGVALTLTAATSLAGGVDGTDLSGGDFTAFLNSLSFRPFSILAYDGTDAPTLALFDAWQEGQAAAFRPVMLVSGGAADDSVSTALARAATMADPNTVTLGVGQYADDLLGVTLTTAQLAPRIAGILAARGEEHSLTYAPLGGLHAVGSTIPTEDQLVTLRDGGVTAIRQTEDPDTDLIISQGVTTFVSKTDISRPYEVFSDPRLVRVMHIFVRSMKQWGDKNIIGDVTVTDESRAAVRAQGQKLLNDLLGRGIILPKDDTVVPAIPAPFIATPKPGTDMLDAIPFNFGWQFARTANYIIGAGVVQ